MTLLGTLCGACVYHMLVVEVWSVRGAILGQAGISSSRSVQHAKAAAVSVPVVHGKTLRCLCCLVLLCAVAMLCALSVVGAKPDGMLRAATPRWWHSA